MDVQVCRMLKNAVESVEMFAGHQRAKRSMRYRGAVHMTVLETANEQR
jgi:hypothetical protein